MKILLIDNGSKHLRSLLKLLKKNEIVTAQFFGQYPSAENFDLIILSGGSKYSILKHPEKFNQEVDLVKTSKIPIIGICEGCEIIAYAYGSVLKKLEKKTKGVKKILITRKYNLVPPISNFKVYEAHRWSITKLGRALLGLAKSKDGFEIIKHKTKNIFGFQFHPEMLVEKTVGDEIFNNLITKVTS